MHPKIKIVIADDHPVVVQGLKWILLNDAGLEVCAAFGLGQQLVDFLEKNAPDLVLLDISLPDCNGTELCKKIKKIRPETCVLMLSNHSERSIILQSLENGASGYLLKNATAQEMISGIREAVRGNIVFDNEVKKIISKIPQNAPKAIPKLTRREKEVLQFLSLGKTTSVIAEELFLSPLTVETHRKNLLQKFGAKNSAEMVKTAADMQLI